MDERREPGSIDDGTELFGNFTEQPPSSEPNGYAALAEFDLVQNGGNGDGAIDSTDAVFSDLLLWVDGNHDGVSQSAEIGSLADHGIEEIGLTYRESRRRDKHGNLFRYAGRVKMGDNRATQSVDVFLLARAD